jgi:pyruvate dehydrogenase E2 component (dihydrolipoamide acetyltransferase)
MPTDVPMPRLSDSMEEGTILKWLVSEGEQVGRGQELVEIETDKANMTYESDTEGTLIEIVAREGHTLPVGEAIARIGAPGEAAPERGEREERKRREEREPEPALAAPAPEPRQGDGRLKASPVARRMARDLGLELARIEGSGPGGRIVKSDVEAAARGGAPEPAEAGAEAEAPPPAPAPRPEPGVRGEPRLIEPTRTQQTVSRRMAHSKATAPDFALSLEVEMGGCLELRSRLRELADPAPSINDMVVKAAARALAEHPRVNAAYRDGRFELYPRVNVGIAVAASEALVVPTIFDADRKALGQIAAEARGLAERVRSGAVTPPELAGGTFTVSNLGMYGIERFTAILNPPQAALLTVGALARKPAVDPATGRIVARDSLTLTLVCDHRILYGAEGAAFLARVRELLERPLALAL